MSSKLYVGNLSWNTTDADLRETFSQFGEITEATVITDRDTGRSRGFGFVTFEDSASSEKAIATLDGSNLDGRTIKVNEAKPRRENGGGGYGGGGRNRW